MLGYLGYCLLSPFLLLVQHHPRYCTSTCAHLPHPASSNCCPSFTPPGRPALCRWLSSRPLYTPLLGRSPPMSATQLAAGLRVSCAVLCMSRM
ncbi:uncharacterized protein B0H18DRAFT_1037173 [Fomitopsis serialis]|uniref:uncharacterized protein n=1 Tax=Fomitopsis serialis TaxID=139415 RepID=UPI0020082BA9|nr:uncharacterized protein B0H18DRAFT_1037173 [Neoantrodia serialis]KAH9916784.1 hypothetical protein B0H18DRAFT_1037173 [Neoantrodia serialis]